MATLADKETIIVPETATHSDEATIIVPEAAPDISAAVVGLTDAEEFQHPVEKDDNIEQEQQQTCIEQIYDNCICVCICAWIIGYPFIIVVGVAAAVLYALVKFIEFLFYYR